MTLKSWYTSCVWHQPWALIEIQSLGFTLFSQNKMIMTEWHAKENKKHKVKVRNGEVTWKKKNSPKDDRSWAWNLSMCVCKCEHLNPFPSVYLLYKHRKLFIRSMISVQMKDLYDVIVWWYINIHARVFNTYWFYCGIGVKETFTQLLLYYPFSFVHFLSILCVVVWCCVFFVLSMSLLLLSFVKCYSSLFMQLSNTDESALNLR